ncbi:MAG: winged helix-turn-helix transcriptional regulator [Candidatus Omnitrophota bacterium]|nr:MAG: winged helix-turn-helix transcriptional regulator [Candidatus Omnitrophota bacterium]
MDEKIKTFKALSDKNRLRILKLLEAKPLCVCELNAILEIAQSSTSQHLKVLKDVGLIKDKKQSYWVNYYLAQNVKDNFIREQLKIIAKSFNDDAVIKKDNRMVRKINRKSLCCK